MYDRDGLDEDGADEVCETHVEQDLRSILITDHIDYLYH